MTTSGGARRGLVLRQLGAVAGGTALSQVLQLTFSPIITRLYGAEPVGALGVFTALFAILLPLASMSYPLALVIPSQDRTALRLAVLSMIWALVWSVLALPVLGMSGEPIAEAIGFGGPSWLLWLLSPALLILSLDQVSSQWLVRRERFDRLGALTAGYAAVSGPLKVALGMVHPTSVSLILAEIIARLGKAMFMARSMATGLERGSWGDLFRWPELRAVATEYRDFATLRTPQWILAGISQGLPIVVIASLFGAEPAGFYAICHRTLRLPQLLVARAVGKVIQPRLAAGAQRGSSLRPNVLRATSGLVVVGLLPFGLVFVYGPDLFGFVFGDEWSRAGEFARWLTPLMLLSLANVPAVESIPYTGSQGFLLVWEIVSTSMRILALLVSAHLVTDVGVSIIAYSVTGAAAQLVLVAEGIRRSGQTSRLREISSSPEPGA